MKRTGKVIDMMEALRGSLAEQAFELEQFEALKPGEGRWWDVADRLYHACALASRSQLEVLRKQPGKFAAAFVERTLTLPETEALRVGRMLHVAVLEPERWPAEFVRDPEEPEKPDFSELGSPQTKAYREALKGWREEVAAERDLLIRRRIVVKRDEYDLVVRMAEAIAAEPAASHLVSGAAGARERSIVWRDAETGILLRARVDVALDAGLLVDVKSTTEPAPEDFVHACRRYGYHRQAACYVEAVRAVTGRDFEFAFVIVNKEPVHEVAVYRLGSRELALGRFEFHEAVRRLAEHRTAGRWRAHWQDTPQTLYFPEYAFPYGFPKE
jgi:exodeoxyribonuclease VIII